MGFFDTLIRGYKIMGRELHLGWQKHGSNILTCSGTGLMLIANGLMAKKGASQEVQQAIADANRAIDEVRNAPLLPAGTENTPAEAKKATKKRKFTLAKAKGKKFVSVGKHFWKETLVSAVGAAAVGAGQHMNNKQKTALATGLAAVSAEFAAYRANVIADAGEEKDFEYLTTKKSGKNDSNEAKNGEISEGETGSDDGFTVKADPSAFKFWCSPETCPSIYSDNLELTIARLKNIEDKLTIQGRTNACANRNGIGTVYLNDMRREFGGLNPKKMDHPLGGIFGRTFDANNPSGMGHIDLGWRNDRDFVEGRKVGVWIIFPCDKEPIVGKVNQGLLAVEDAV